MNDNYKKHIVLFLFMLKTTSTKNMIVKAMFDVLNILHMAPLYYKDIFSF